MRNIYSIFALIALLIATGLPVNAQVIPNDPDFGPHQEYLRVVTLVKNVDEELTEPQTVSVPLQGAQFYWPSQKQLSNK